MFSNKIRAALVALGSVLVLALPAAALAQNPLEWTTNQGASETGQPSVYGTYTLANLHEPVRVYGPGGSYWDTYKDLVFGNETWSVDLDWYTPSYSQFPVPGNGQQWKFVRQVRNRFMPQISGNERVALYNTVNHQYLADGGEPCGCGVNLVWSSTPHYEWQVANGLLNQATFSVRSTELYNTSETQGGRYPGGYLIMHNQTFGVDLSWLHAPFSLPYAYTEPQRWPPIANPGGSLAP